jgi:hypothetical protein
MTKRKKTVEVERTSSISYSYLKEILKVVPKECRDSINLEHQEYYYPYENSPSHSIVISYERLETDEEEAEREIKELEDQKRWQARELETLKILQAKYKGQANGLG